MKHTLFSVIFSRCYLAFVGHKDWDASLLLLWPHWRFFSMQILRQTSIHYQYHDILFLVCYGSIYVLVCIQCLYYFLLQMLSVQVTGQFYLKSSSSSSSSSWCRAASTDIPDHLSPLLPIIHRLGSSSGLHPESSHSCCPMYVMYICVCVCVCVYSSWSSCFCLAICGGP